MWLTASYSTEIRSPPATPSKAMVEEGLLVPTGEMRSSPIPGRPPQPVYVTREQAKESSVNDHGESKREDR
jgi:hypothetical protein